MDHDPHTTIKHTFARLIQEPHPTEKTHFYIETEDGKKSVFDKTIHEFLRENDLLPVLYSKDRQYAIPQLTSLVEIQKLNHRGSFFGNN